MAVDDIETYCENGIWKTRWRASDEPFAAGGGDNARPAKARS